MYFISFMGAWSMQCWLRFMTNSEWKWGHRWQLTLIDLLVLLVEVLHGAGTAPLGSGTSRTCQHTTLKDRRLLLHLLTSGLSKGFLKSVLGHSNSLFVPHPPLGPAAGLALGGPLTTTGAIAGISPFWFQQPAGKGISPLRVQRSSGKGSSPLRVQKGSLHLGRMGHLWLHLH